MQERMNDRRIARIAALIVAVDSYDALEAVLREMVDKAGLTKTGDEAKLIARGMEVPSFTRGLRKTVEHAGSKWGFRTGDDFIEDAVQIVVHNYLMNPRHFRYLKRLSGVPWKGVLAALNKMTWNNMSQVFRAEAVRRKKMVNDEAPETEERFVPEQDEIEAGRAFREMRRDLEKHVGQRGSKIEKAMLKEYMRAASGYRGPDGVVMKKDVYPLLWDKGFTIKEAQMSKVWLGLKKLMVEFFEDELGKRVSDKVKRMLRVSFRMRIASWVLRRV